MKEFLYCIDFVWPYFLKFLCHVSWGSWCLTLKGQQVQRFFVAFLLFECWCYPVSLQWQHDILIFFFFHVALSLYFIMFLLLSVFFYKVLLMWEMFCKKLLAAVFSVTYILHNYDRWTLHSTDYIALHCTNKEIILSVWAQFAVVTVKQSWGLSCLHMLRHSKCTEEFWRIR